MKANTTLLWLVFVRFLSNFFNPLFELWVSKRIPLSEIMTLPKNGQKICSQFLFPTQCSSILGCFSEMPRVILDEPSLLFQWPNSLLLISFYRKTLIKEKISCLYFCSESCNQRTEFKLCLTYRSCSVLYFSQLCFLCGWMSI